MSNPRSGAPKRVAAGLVAGALSVFGLALAPSAGAVASVTTERYAGANRYDTAKLISADEAFAAPKSAIVATGENFADALAASTLAGTVRPAPIILTSTAALSTESAAALTALKGKGVTTVHIVGGTSAVSQTTEDAIKALGLTVVRHAGSGTAANRYGTAAQIATDANAIQATGSVSGLKAAFFATGLNFADAVAAAPGAYAARLPILLVNDGVPAETAAAITSLGIKKAYVLGGTAAVSDTVATALATATGNPVTRLQGTADAGSSQDRFGTAAAVADFLVGTLGFTNPTSAILANGTDAKGGVDALASGPLGGEVKAPVLLTASLPAATTAWLDKNSSTLTKVYASGGTTVIDDATLAAAVTAAQTTANDTTGNTSRPELVASAVQSTVTSGLLAGTTVRFTFDEAISTATVGGFWVVDAAGTRLQGSGAANATIVAATPTSVDVLFPSIVSPTVASGLTLATVDNGAVTDTQGEANPEDDAALGTASATTLPAGTTQAPDLTAVQNFRAATTTITFVDFVFDQAATSVTPSYNLVTTAGDTSVACTLDSGNGTTTHTVQCLNSNFNVDPLVGLASSQIARGFVRAGVARSATLQTNPLEAADVSASGNTGTPDLVSATFNTAAKTAAGVDIDTATLVFDQPVAAGGASLTGYAAYYLNGTESAAPTPGYSAVTPTSVLLTFPDGALTNAVGINIDDDTVIASSGANIGQGNEEDEVGVTGSTAGTTGGQTSDPDLTAVIRSAGADIFGTPTGGFNITYVFDEDVDPAAVDATRFFLYLADGTRLVGAAGQCFVGATEATDNTVTCLTVGANPGYDVNTAGGTNATNAATGAAVLGTVDNAAVGDEVGTGSNNEAARPVTAPPAA